MPDTTHNYIDTRSIITVVVILAVMIIFFAVLHYVRKKKIKSTPHYGTTAAAGNLYAIKYSDKIIVYRTNGEILFEYSGDANIYSKDDSIRFVLPDGTEKIYNEVENRLAD